MKKIITSFFCGLSLWADAQTSGGGDPPAPGPDNNHNYAIPGGGAFVTPGKGFIAPGTGNHGFASPGQTNGFSRPGKGFVAPGHGFIAPRQTNGFVTPGNGFIAPRPGNGFVTPRQPPTNSPPQT